MSAGKTSFAAVGLARSYCVLAAATSMMTVSRSTRPMYSRPCASKVPSLNGVARDSAPVAAGPTRAKTTAATGRMDRVLFILRAPSGCFAGYLDLLRGDAGTRQRRRDRIAGTDLAAVG